jgi:hypothetical protein
MCERSRLIRRPLALALMACLTVLPCHAQENSGPGNGGTAHSIAIDVSIRTPNTSIDAKAGEMPLMVKPRVLKQIDSIQRLRMDGTWPSDSPVRLSLSARRGNNYAMRDPEPEFLVHSVVIDGISFPVSTFFSSKRMRSMFEIEVKVPKWRSDTTSARFQLTLPPALADSLDLPPPTVSLTCDGIPLPNEFVLLSGKAPAPISIPLSRCDETSGSSHLLEVTLVSDPQQLPAPVRGKVAFIDASGHSVPIARNGGDGSKVIGQAEFALTGQQSSVGYQTQPATAADPESSDVSTVSQPPVTPPVTPADPAAAAPPLPNVMPEIRTLSRKIDFVFDFLVFTALGLGAAAIFGFLRISRVHTDLSALKSWSDTRQPEQASDRLNTSPGRFVSGGGDISRAPSGGGDDRTRQYGELLGQMKSRMDEFQKLTDSLSKLITGMLRQASNERTKDAPTQTVISQSSAAEWRTPVTAASAGPPVDPPPTRHDPADFVRPESRVPLVRLKEIVLEYDDAVRDSQDAMSFFERHDVQSLVLDTRRTSNQGLAVLVGEPQKPALAAPFWGLQTSDGRWWVFPGFSLYSQRNALSAGGWHEAKESLTELYDLVAGTGFLKDPASVQKRAGKFICHERGKLELPQY